MGILQKYIVQMTCSSIICSIVLSFVKEGSIKGILQLVVGIFLTLTVIAPLRDWELPDTMELPGISLQNGYEAAAVGEAFALNAREEIIKEELEAYILDKANDMGCSILVQLEMTEEGYPESVVITGQVRAGEQAALEDILEEELGIAKEMQIWNG